MATGDELYRYCSTPNKYQPYTFPHKFSRLSVYMIQTSVLDFSLRYEIIKGADGYICWDKYLG